MEILICSSNYSSTSVKSFASLRLDQESERERRQKGRLPGSLRLNGLGVGDFVDRYLPNRTPLSENRELKMEVGAGEFLNEEETILDFLNYIHVLALPHGGQVFKVIGNHDTQYLWSANRLRRDDAFGSKGALTTRFQMCGVYGVLQIYNLFFVHGGLLPLDSTDEKFDLHKTMNFINTNTRDLYEKPEKVAYWVQSPTMFTSNLDKHCSD
jgi:hypothetical protein